MRRWPGSCGAIYAAIQGSWCPSYFTVTVLITIYAMVILGGLGSIAGRHLRRDRRQLLVRVAQPQTDHPDVKRWLFYGVIVLLDCAARSRGTGPSSSSAGTVAFGFVVHAIVGGVLAAVGVGHRSGTTVCRRWLAHPHWVILPNRTSHGNVDHELPTSCSCVAVVLVRSAQGVVALIALVPTL